MRNPLRIAMLGAGLCAGALGLAGETGEVTIRMQKESFVPPAQTVPAGTRVNWINTDSVPHSVTADDGRLDSGPILPGKSFAWTADGPGMHYHCIFHPSMVATVTVEAGAGKAAAK